MRRRERLLDSSDSDHVDLFESPVQLFETKAPGAAKQKKLDDVNVAIAFKWNGYDSCFILMFLFLGLFSRMWNLQDPRNFLFRENQTLAIVGRYQKPEFFVSSESEFAYLLFWDVANRMKLHESLNDNTLKVTNDGFGNRIYVSLRSISAFPAATVVPLVYITARLFGSEQLYAFFASVFCLLEPSLIVPARAMDTAGLVQLFVVLTLMFCGMSWHIGKDCFAHYLVVFCAAMCSAMAFASDVHCVVFALFAVLWPWLVHDKKTESGVCLGVVLAVAYLSTVAHMVIVTGHVTQSMLPHMTNYQKNNFYNNGTQQVPPRLKAAHFVCAMQIVVYRVFRTLFEFVRHPNILRMLQRFLLLASPTCLYSSAACSEVCRTNSYIAIPAAILCHSSLLMAAIRHSYHDHVYRLCLLFLATVVVSSCGVSFGSTNTYLAMIVCLVTTPLCVPRHFSTHTASTLLTILVALAGYSFVTSASTTYATSP